MHRIGENSLLFKIFKYNLWNYDKQKALMVVFKRLCLSDHKICNYSLWKRHRKIGVKIVSSTFKYKQHNIRLTPLALNVHCTHEHTLPLYVIHSNLILSLSILQQFVLNQENTWLLIREIRRKIRQIMDEKEKRSQSARKGYKPACW